MESLRKFGLLDAEGKLISMTSRVVRLFAPDPTAQKPHVDLSYDWVIPMR